MPSEHATTTGMAGHPATTAWRSFCLASAAVFLVLLDTAAVIGTHAPLRAHFGGVSALDLSWTLNAYTVPFAALLVPAGAGS